MNKIDGGNKLVNQSGETMEEVVTSIKRVNDIMSEIAAASSEQASSFPMPKKPWCIVGWHDVYVHLD